MRSLAIVLLVVAAAGAQTPAPATPDTLLEAARRGDRAAVVSMLDRGVDVNARSRYGVTALAFAAGEGRLEIVRLLVERGADIQLADSFYGMRAIDAAIRSNHTDIVLFLIERGSKGAVGALFYGIRNKHLALVNATLASEEVDATALNSATGLAAKMGDPEIVERVKKAADAKLAALPPFIALDAAVLAAFAGRYIGPAGSAPLTVAADDRGLILALPGAPALQLQPFEARQFRAVSAPGTIVVFSGRGGIIERMTITRDGKAMGYGREGFADATSPAVLASPAAAVAAPATAAAPTTAPSTMARSAARPWPAFRGANAAGSADGQGAVSEWDVASGRNIKWKTPIPGLAISSPIVWGTRVIVVSAASEADQSFRTGLYGDVTPVNDASAHSWRVHALDLRTGKELWNREVFAGVPRTKRHPKSSQANATPVTDGERIVAVFGAIGQMVCYDMNGKLLWKTDLGALDSGWFLDPSYQWGHASSPVIYKGMVIVQADMSKGSFLAGFNLKDGREVWRTPRTDEVSTWGTPTVLSGPKGDELVTNGTRIRGYDPATGKVLWTLSPNSEIAVGSPVVQRDVVFVTGGYPPVRPVYAVRAGSRGDISLPKGQTSSEAIMWSHDRDGTYISTPIVYRDQLYTLNNNGILSAYDSETGKLIFRSRVAGGGAFSASPVAADGKLYMANEDGDVIVLQAGREYRELAKNSMGEVVMATPAISDGMVIVRTLHHVWGIGQ